MKISVETLQMNMTLKARALTAVGLLPVKVATQTTAAMAAMASSTIMPAAPTMTRCHLCRKAHALEAST